MVFASAMVGKSPSLDPNTAAARIQVHYRARLERLNKVQVQLSAVREDSEASSRLEGNGSKTTGQNRSRASTLSRSNTSGMNGRVVHCSTTANLNRLYEDYLRSETRLPANVHQLRVRTYFLLEEPRSSVQAQVLSVILLTLIVVSITTFMLETMPELKSVSEDVWLAIEVVCTIAFTIEYCARVAVCTVTGSTVWDFVAAPSNLVDLMAILPFYVWLAMKSLKVAKALGMLRTVRLVRLFRVFKLGRYSSGLQLMMVALKNSSQALWVLSFFLGIGIILFSSAIYYVEKMGCPERQELVQKLVPGTNMTQLDHYLQECLDSPSTRVSKTYGLCCNEHDAPYDFPTIIQASWWSIVTMTTVGFGEVRPRTDLGRVVGVITMLSGILLLALPIAIIGRKFQEAYEERHGQAHKVSSGNQIYHAASLTPMEMLRKLRTLKLPGKSHPVARELADDFEDFLSMSAELRAMEAHERNRQNELLAQFDNLLTYFCKVASASGDGSSKSLDGKVKKSDSPRPRHFSEKDDSEKPTVVR